MAMYYKGKELPPGEPLPDELAIRILTNLYRCAALSQGLDPDELEIEITRKDKHTNDAVYDSGRAAAGGDHHH